MTDIEALAALQRIETHLLLAKQALDRFDFSKEPQNMAVSTTVAALIQQIDDATNAIAARIATLVANAGLSADDQAAFGVEIAKLQALGSDPNNPVPPAA